MSVIVEQLRDEQKRLNADLAAISKSLKTVERALEGLADTTPTKKRGRPRKPKPTAEPSVEQ
jgi:hypothetical protein